MGVSEDTYHDFENDNQISKRISCVLSVNMEEPTWLSYHSAEVFSKVDHTRKEKTQDGSHQATAGNKHHFTKIAIQPN